MSRVLDPKASAIQLSRAIPPVHRPRTPTPRTRPSALLPPSMLSLPHGAQTRALDASSSLHRQVPHHEFRPIRYCPYGSIHARHSPPYNRSMELCVSSERHSSPSPRTQQATYALTSSYSFTAGAYLVLDASQLTSPVVIRALSGSRHLSFASGTYLAFANCNFTVRKKPVGLPVP
jgi:hypothetical protein